MLLPWVSRRRAPAARHRAQACCNKLGSANGPIRIARSMLLLIRSTVRLLSSSAISTAGYFNRKAGITSADVICPNPAAQGRSHLQAYPHGLMTLRLGLSWRIAH